MSLPLKARMSDERMKALLKFMQQLKVDKRSKKSTRPSKKPDRLELIDEALTHTSANQKRNHERLEFLGDAVLRLVASEFIERHYPKMSVGERSSLRAQLVSDRWLSEVGKKIQINKVLIIGKKAAGDTYGKETLLAEATEALIGAIYEYWEDLEPIHNLLTPYWLNESKLILANPDYYNCKSALQEWYQSKKESMPSIPIYKSEEKNTEHGNPKRFFCKIYIREEVIASGWGRSRRESEQEAAREALDKIKTSDSKHAISTAEIK